MAASRGSGWTGRRSRAEGRLSPQWFRPGRDATVPGMLERGTLRVARYRGAPILLHWSLALGLLAFGGFAFVPGFWLGFTVLILVHELGHAYLVRRLGFAVEAVVVHGFGGFCSWNGRASRLEHSVIAWGGVIAQALLLGATFAYVQLMGPATSAFGFHLQDAWIRANLWIMALNLLPVAPLDGAEAWQIFRAMRVESVTFGQVLRRCLPGFGGRRRKLADEPPARGSDKPTSERPPSKPGAAASDGEPSAEAQRAIADALRRISEQARDARKK